MARVLSVGLLSLVLACGHEAPASTVEPAVDRTPGERPAGAVLELALDGGDDALASLAGQLPPSPLRSGWPTRVSVLLDGMIELPSEIGDHVDASSPIRLVMARVDGELRSAIAVRLEAPLAGHRGGGPRGTDRIGDRAAVDDRIAVVADDASLLEAAFPYLAYGALAAPSPSGVVVLHVPSATLATTVRTAMEHAVEEQRGRALGSIREARDQHGPPDLGDPEPLATAIADALLARIAYLPDLGDAIVRLEPTPSGLAITMTSDVTNGSPLAAVLAGYEAVPTSLVASMPTASFVALATGTNAQTRVATGPALMEVLAAIAGPRMSAAERAQLDAVATSITLARGDQGALALGVDDDRGLFVATATRGASAAAWQTPWGRALPWTSGLLAALFRCDAPPSGSSLCGGVALDTRADASGLRVEVVSRRPAEVASPILEQRGASSPDLARDLASLPASTFATLVVRPLRMLPIMSLLGGPGAGLPRGDGAFVLGLAYDRGQLTISLRASGAAMADLASLQRLFANGSDSE